MADNIAVTPGAGVTVAADDISSVFYQRVKVSWGVDGSAVDASASNPFPVTVSNTNANGQTTMANSAPVVIASNQTAVPIAITDFTSEYETVAASQTSQVLGSTGATGDWIQGILVVPATTSPGQVLLIDNATSITVFTGGAVPSVIPFFIPLGIKSVSGSWRITTGTNVSCVAIGNFS